MQKHKLIFISATFLVICSGYSSTISDRNRKSVQYSNMEEVRKSFVEHRSEFESVKDNLLKEPMRRFTIASHSGLKDSKISQSTVDACDKLMDEIDSFTTIRLDNLIRFELNHAQERNKVSDWAIAYDPERRFTQPNSKFRAQRKLLELEPNWFVVSDAIDTSNFPLRIERAKAETIPQN